MIYVSVHAASCDVSNNLDVEEPAESSPVHHLNLNMFKTLVMLFQVIGLHGPSILPDTQVENL